MPVTLISSLECHYLGNKPLTLWSSGKMFLTLKQGKLECVASIFPLRVVNPDDDNAKRWKEHH